MSSSRWFGALALVALAWVAYAEVSSLGFIDLDDAQYVAANPAVLSGLSFEGLRYAFTSTELGNWHPLTWLSHMATVSLFGQAPAGHHAVNLSLHVLASVLCFGWLIAATRRTGVAFVVAALFAVHPLRVESVAWIAERKDVLSGALFFGALWVYTRFTQASTRGRYWSAWLLFALGLLSKSMLVTFPLVLLLVDRWPLRRQAPTAALVLEKLPFFLGSIVFAALAFWTQSLSGAVGDLETYSLADRVTNSLSGLWFYVDRTLWPRDLAVFYPFVESRPLWTSAALGLAALGLTAGAWRLREDYPQLWMGWAWFLVTLAPVIGLVQIGLQAHADRYAYLPQVGLLIAIVWSLAVPRERSLPTFARYVLVAVALGGCTLLTRNQVHLWRSDRALFEHAVEVTDDNYFALVKLGQIQSAEGRAAEAVALFERALAIDPDYPIAHNNLGTELFRQGRVRDAIVHFEEAIRIQPVNFEPLANLAGAWWTLGEAELADEYARRALAIRPNAEPVRRYLR